MQSNHKVYCDQNHTPRQQCNDALAPVGMQPIRVEPVDAPIDVAETVESEREEEPASSVMREAVLTAEVPRPTAYVTREWERTAAAVEATVSDDDRSDVEDDVSPGGSAMRIAVMVVAVAVVWMIVRAVGGRTNE